MRNERNCRPRHREKSEDKTLVQALIVLQRTQAEHLKHQTLREVITSVSRLVLALLQGGL